MEILFLGDINFKGVSHSEGIFDNVSELLKSSKTVFANLECCLSIGLADAPSPAFCADPRFAKTLANAGISVIGNANNVNYGPEAIVASNGMLDEAGIVHVGSGSGTAEAYAAKIVEQDGRKIGFLQRTAIYWPSGHAAEENQAGVATIRGHTAYRPVLEHHAALTRPGVPPQIVTWADEASVAKLQQKIRDIRSDVDLLVASFHWGYKDEVLQYQKDFARAAIDAGADVVFGHGPHIIAPLERYKDKIIFYGLGNFVFHVAHTADIHSHWTGLVARLTLTEDGRPQVDFAFVEKHNENKPQLTTRSRHAEEFERLNSNCEENGLILTKTDEIWSRVVPIG